jgi:hypothetical protein
MAIGKESDARACASAWGTGDVVLAAPVPEMVPTIRPVRSGAVMKSFLGVAYVSALLLGCTNTIFVGDAAGTSSAGSSGPTTVATATSAGAGASPPATSGVGGAGGATAAATTSGVGGAGGATWSANASSSSSSGISDPTCAGAGDVAYFDGDPGDYIHPGVDTITQGNWSYTATPTNVAIHVDPTDAAQGLWWDFTFESSMLPGSPALTIQDYPNTERWPFESPGHPGLDITGDGRGCNMSAGDFKITDFTLQGSTLVSFTASFTQYCDGGPALHGCVHVQQ